MLTLQTECHRFPRDLKRANLLEQGRMLYIEVRIIFETHPDCHNLDTFSVLSEHHLAKAYMPYEIGY
jgi:hypothetical protein